jgi:parvulin-like peptidyl-prolyl isomerase
VSAHSEDASTASGGVLVVTPDSSFVAPFEALSLRLEVGEAGLVRTAFGWHVIERVE